MCISENISFAEENECDRLFVMVVVHAKNMRTIFLASNTSTVLSRCVLKTTTPFGRTRRKYPYVFIRVPFGMLPASSLTSVIVP